MAEDEEKRVHGMRGSGWGREEWRQKRYKIKFQYKPTGGFKTIHLYFCCFELRSHNVVQAG